MIAGKLQQVIPFQPPGKPVWVRVVVSTHVDRISESNQLIIIGAGSILGTIINGWLITAFGPRKVLLATLFVMTCFLFIVFFAQNRATLLVGEILLGFEWGIVRLSITSNT